MKINVNNTDKLQAAINDVQTPRITARRISVTDIIYAIEHEIEPKLSKMLYKKDWQGLTFAVDPHAQIFPACYRGIPGSTRFTVQRGSNAWFLTSIGRSVTSGPDGRIVPLNLETKSSEIMGYVIQSRNWSR